MKKLTVADVRNLHEYELARDESRRRAIEEKARRRVALGPKMSLVFENRATILHQVQEMCRSERLARPEKIQEELDVYNTLLPDDGELAATLFIEITDAAAIQRELDGMVTLADGTHLYLELGGRRISARFGAGESREDRLAAVQYLRFPVGTDPAAAEALRSGGAPVTLRVDHPAYQASTELSTQTRQSLAKDLAE